MLVDSESEKQPLLVIHQQSDRMSIFRRSAYGVGHVLNDICAALWFSYTLLFLQEVLGMKPILAGSLLMIGQVADAVATPIVGILSDRFGTRKTWHLAGSCLVILSFPLIFYTCPNCATIPEVNSNNVIIDTLGPEPSFDWLLICSYVGLIVVFQVGWAVVQISHLSMIPDLRASQKGRTELTAIRYTASVCSSVTVYVITWLVFHTMRNKEVMNTIGPDDAYKFRKIVIIGLAIGVVCTIWFHAGLRKSSRNIPRLFQNPRKLTNITSYFRTPLLLQVASLYVASRLFLTISLIYVPLYLDEGLDEEAETLASVPLVSYITSFISSLGIKYFNNYLGNKMSYLLGGVLSILGCIWIGYGMNNDYISTEIYGVAILLGAGSSITTVTSLCITADLIGTETESGAFVYSIVTFADKLFTGLAVVIIEYFKCTNKVMCPHYYRNILAHVCGASAIFGLIVLATLTSVTLGNRIKEDVPIRPHQKEDENCSLLSDPSTITRSTETNQR